MTINKTHMQDAANIANGDKHMATYQSGPRVCVLWQQEGRYFMQTVGVDASAAHTLDVASTNIDRLAAHWAGFCGCA